MPFGQTINAGLMRPDYSAIERAGQARGAGFSALGEGIGQALEIGGEYFKQQKEKKKTIKQSELYIDAAITMFPELESSLVRAKNEINDENIPLDERYAAASSVQGLLNMGMERMKYNDSIMQAEMAQRAKMAELASKPLNIQEVYDSQGNIRQMVNQGGRLRPVEEVISGNIPQLPADMQDEIDATMPSPDEIGNGMVLPGRPIEGQIEQLIGLTPDGNVKLVANGEEIETDKGTFIQKWAGDRMASGEIPPEQAAAEAAQILSAMELQNPKKEDAIMLGIKPAEPKKPKPVEMTAEQVDELTSRGMRVSATPTQRGTFLVEETTSSPESKGQTYTEPYVDESTGQVVQRRGDGKITVLKESSDQRTLAAIQEARRKYNSGDAQGALDILASVRIKGAFGGYPTVDDLEQYFGVIQPQDVEPDVPQPKQSLLERIQSQKAGE